MKEQSEWPARPSEEFADLIKDVPDDRAKELDEQVLWLIDHVVGRIDYTERRRFGYLQLALGMWGIAGTGGILLGSLWTRGAMGAGCLGRAILGSGVGFLFTVFATGFVLIIKYDQQTNPKYPFIGLSSPWKWFYHHAFARPMRSKVNYREAEREQYRRDYVYNLVQYTRQFTAMKPQDSLDADLQQLFLVLANEQFKNDFQRELQRILRWGILVSVALLFVLFVTLLAAPYVLGV